VHSSDPTIESPLPTEHSEKRATFPQRIRGFAGKPMRQKYASLVQRFHRTFPKIPAPFRLPFGAWFLLGDSLLDRELLWGGFENAELRFVERFLQPGMRVLDIGAHHGLYTLLASKLVGSAGKVVAFEPSPRERRLLARNLQINFSSNVRVEACALGSGPSKADLFLVEGGEDGCNSLRAPAVVATTQTVSVDVISLDDYLLTAGIGPIDLVKLDVEGGEREVLRGAATLINGASRPVFLVEVQDVRTRPWGYAACEIVKLLDRAGYQWFHILDNGSLAPADVHDQEYDANLVAIPRDRVQAVFEKLGG